MSSSCVEHPKAPVYLGCTHELNVSIVCCIRVLIVTPPPPCADGDPPAGAQQTGSSSWRLSGACCSRQLCWSTIRQCSS
jgi:hypothetical protein